MSLVTKLEGFIMPLFHLYSVICKAKKKTERKKDRKTEKYLSLYYCEHSCIVDIEMFSRRIIGIGLKCRV